MIFRFVRKGRRERKAVARRVVILGLDGLSPEIASELMAGGMMPNLAGLAEKGTFTELGTTCPGISPVAWSSFQTGVNPGKHGIFDFLAPDRRRYLPRLSSVETLSAEHRNRFLPFLRPSMKQVVRLLRKSRPFWSLLGRYGLRSTVLRVPITYPPEPLDGHLLSGMCVPDLRGTQGSYTIFSENEPGAPFTGGLWGRLRRRGDCAWEASLPGPYEPGGDPACVDILLQKGRKGFMLRAGGATIPVEPGRLTEWVELVFRTGGAKVRGIAKFCLSLREGNSPELYATAINVSPMSPSVPVSHPVHYSRYLAGINGNFATLGLAEDTWALSNGALSEEAFLDQAWSIFEERRKMFLDALQRNPSGLVACVFDTSDRIQHMFWSAGHAQGSPVFDMYLRMDRLIGETVRELGGRDMLIVMSDHGFTSFHTCVDFNRWLLENGYMVLEEGVESVETSFRGVDWSGTRAWSMGLAGIMLNIRGREAGGIVEPGSEAQELAAEICEGLLRLTDADGNSVISSAVPAAEVYSGPYAAEGPDIIVGTSRGYRAGWGCVTGGVGERVLYPNERHWDGDHCHDHRLVPGVLACSRELSAEDAEIVDIAPTVLSALGVRPPSYMEGRSLLPRDDGGEE